MAALPQTAELEMPDLRLETSPAVIRAGGMHLEHISGELVTGHIDANEDHHTPWGIVHGGVYATAIEAATSIGASHAVKDTGRFAVGLANHTEFLRPHRTGRLDVRATPVHQGRTGQLWQCEITRADGKLVARGSVRLQNVDLR